MLARLTIQAEIIVPLFLHELCAGFPSPADDLMDETIDLTRLLVTNPPVTFLWKVDGHSMRDAGTYDEDLLVVDRSLAPRHGEVVATVHGERSLKRLHMSGSTRTCPSRTERCRPSTCQIGVLRKGRRCRDHQSCRR